MPSNQTSNQTPINIPKSCINHIMQVFVLGLPCYLEDIFITKNCFFFNPCLMFSKDLMLSFIDKVTTGT